MQPVRYQKIIMSLVVGLPLLGVCIAMVLLWQKYFFWTDFALLIVLYTLSVLGITIGYHRMLTHQGFQAPEWLRGLILICGCLPFQGAPDSWAALHIKHHAHSDHEDDPHSPLDGFWHAHMGWLFSTDHYGDVRREFGPHLLQDRTVRFVSRTSLLWGALGLLIPYLIGGFTGFIWGGLVRIFLVNHVTYSVNSICHVFGHRPFETTDESRNHWLIGMLAFGEGWHNNHHAFPTSAIQGLRWWQFDGSGLIIRALQRVGLVWNVQTISHETVVNKMEQSAATIAARDQIVQELLAHVTAARAELDRMKEASVTALREMCTSGLQRLNAIQEHVMHATHLKKQRLREYMQETQMLVERCRAQMATV